MGLSGGGKFDGGLKGKGIKGKGKRHTLRFKVKKGGGKASLVLPL